jgi:hypothetical protein
MPTTDLRVVAVHDQQHSGRGRIHAGAVAWSECRFWMGGCGPRSGAIDSGSSVQPVCVRHCEVVGDGLVEVGNVLDHRASAEANVLADGRLALAEQG